MRLALASSACTGVRGCYHFLYFSLVHTATVSLSLSERLIHVVVVRRVPVCIKSKGTCPDTGALDIQAQTKVDRTCAGPRPYYIIAVTDLMFEMRDLRFEIHSTTFETQAIRALLSTSSSLFLLFALYVPVLRFSLWTIRQHVPT